MYVLLCEKTQREREKPTPLYDRIGENRKCTSASTLEDATYPSRVASTGVLQGDAANAKVSPAK